MSALTLGLVGPLPPPNGGMAMQTRQLARLLGGEGVDVQLVQTNAPYRPAFIEKVKVLRALFRLVPYLWAVWRLAGRVDVIHLMANSGWSWQLFSAPVLWLGALRGTPVIVNYRGGEAREYLGKSARWVKPSLAKAACVVVPSGFLEQVFAEHDVPTTIIPNIIDLDTFTPASNAGEKGSEQFTLAITRNLEPIYGLETAIACVAELKDKIPSLVLKIAGSGPQRQELEKLAAELGVAGQVEFLGRLDRPEVVALYQSADAMLNPSLVDNMPNSVLEALACGLPVVSTDVGGVPFIVADGETALLVPPKDAGAMAAAVDRIHGDPALRERLRTTGLAMVQRFTWQVVGSEWLGLYRARGAAA